MQPQAPMPQLFRASRSALFAISGVLLALGAVFLLALTGTKISDSIIATAAVVALVGAFGSIQGARNIARQELTYGYIARFNSPELLTYRSRLSSYWNIKAPPAVLDNVFWAQLTEAERRDIRDAWLATPEEAREDEKWAQWQRMEPNERADTLVFMNFMEELAGAYKLRLLDARSVKKHVAPDARSRYAQGAWWIERIRVERKNPRLLQEWEKMDKDLQHVSEDKSAVAGLLERIWSRAKAEIGGS